MKVNFGDDYQREVKKNKIDQAQAHKNLTYDDITVHSIKPKYKK